MIDLDLTAVQMRKMDSLQCFWLTKRIEGIVITSPGHVLHIVQTRKVLNAAQLPLPLALMCGALQQMIPDEAPGVKAVSGEATRTAQCGRFALVLQPS